jgi:hypothetical protein
MEYVSAVLAQEKGERSRPAVTPGGDGKVHLAPWPVHLRPPVSRNDDSKRPETVTDVGRLGAEQRRARGVLDRVESVPVAANPAAYLPAAPLWAALAPHRFVTGGFMTATMGRMYAAAEIEKLTV